MATEAQNKYPGLIYSSGFLRYRPAEQAGQADIGAVFVI